ncbi:MAG: hypothetical protein KDC88_14230, partial [Ignavibacteriae bacterium]|nr:hypothetical protein [Ignavibacteriota bacterium]
NTINTVKLTCENFKNPPNEMGILPFWFWNGEMNEEEMEWQLREYKNKGISGVFLHGRFGEKIGYLSDTWLERTKFAVKKAKEIGIDLWIYDEMNWPSGTAYRKVPKDNPKLRQKYLEMVTLPVPGPIFTFLEATDDRYVNTGNSKPILAYACSEEEFQTEIKEIIDLTPNLSFDAVIPWEAPKGKWRLLYFLEKEIDYYIDALNPESTRKFLDETHEKYKTAVVEDFGKTVPGFYTDEPAMHYYHMGMTNQVIPWTSKMFKIFRQRRGYDLKPHMPALFLNMGKKTAKIRYDFWLTLTEQYSESYYKQIRNWCDDNNLLFTGHLLAEEWLWGQARCEGNIFKHLKHMHITGVDHLYPIIGTEENPDQHVAIKIASSAAHHYGSNRLLCESMGGAYWDCTLERMKWIGDWEYVLGVNIFNNHGYHYSIEGERKRDWPPSQFYHHTWWKDYGYFTKYMTRLGHILSGGKHVAKVLMLYPITSAWTNYKPTGPNNYLNIIQSELNFLTDALLRLHHDFDYTDEDILAEAEVKDGKIIIRDEEYSLLLLPPTTHMQLNSFEKIGEFLNNGGNLIVDSLLPFDLLNYEGEDGYEKIKNLFEFDPNKLSESALSEDVFKLIKTRNGQVNILQGPGLFKKKNYQLLKDAVESFITPDVIIDSKDVFYLHRVKDDHDIYFLVNNKQEEIGTVKISFEMNLKPELWNPNTGAINPIHVYTVKNERVEIQLNFSATDSHIVVFRSQIDAFHVTETNLEVDEISADKIIGHSLLNGETPYVIYKAKKLTEKSKKPLNPIVLQDEYEYELLDDNVLLIDNWKMKMFENDTSITYAELYYDDSDWLDVTMGAWEMQLPQERDNPDYPVILWYRTNFVIDQLPNNLRLLIDGFSGSDYDLYVNNLQVLEKGRRSKIDAEIKEIDISKYLEKGKNIIAVKLTVNKRTDGILDKLKIVGDFAVGVNNGSQTISAKPEKIKIGDWTKQGFPFYSGTVRYKCNVEIYKEYTNGKLFFSADCKEDVLNLNINDKENIILPWHPYRTEVTKFM